jgi:plasmid stabilization system protein ParE
MRFRPSFRRAARLEYDEAASWYEGQWPGLGAELVAEIPASLRNAQRFPQMLADVRCVRVRRFPYSIFLRIRYDRLIVLSVFHARRAPGIWRERV